MIDVNTFWYKPQIADRNIITFKILLYNEKENKFRLPLYELKDVPQIPCTLDASEDKEEIEKGYDFDKDSKLYYIIKNGFVWSYDCGLINNFILSNEVVVQCTIPKGTSYYECDGQGYMSKQLELSTIVPLDKINGFVRGKWMDRFYPTTRWEENS